MKTTTKISILASVRCVYFLKALLYVEFILPSLFSVWIYRFALAKLEKKSLFIFVVWNVVTLSSISRLLTI